MHNNLDEVHNNLVGVSNNLDGVHNNLDEVHNNLVGVSNNLDGVHNNLDAVHNNLDEVFNNLDGVHNNNIVNLLKINHGTHWMRGKTLYREELAPYSFVFAIFRHSEAGLPAEESRNETARFEILRRLAACSE